MSDRPVPSILYVDDNESQRRALTCMLRAAGFHTREAGTGSEALDLAATQPDLIILDVDLPDLSGFEVCRRIKAHPATSAIPVLHLSGVFVKSDDRTAGLDGGADGYLTKPVEPSEAVATVRSLLRIHRAEEAARAAARQWQATFDAIHDPLALLDQEGRILRCNQALGELLGRDADQLIGHALRALLEEAFGPSAAERACPRPGESAREVALGPRWFLATADPVAGAGSTFCIDQNSTQGGTDSVNLLTDITQRKSLEGQLLQAQKMEAVGRLAGGIAHDFNNLLTAIIGNLGLALAAKPELPQHEALTMAERAAWRAAELTRQLLRFSRQEPSQPRPADLNACVLETVELLRRVLGATVEIALRCDEHLGPVLADPRQVQQVLMNLCLNARDAMPQGGRMTIETSTVPANLLDVPRRDPSGAQRDAVEVRSQAPAGATGRAGFARLRVEDTGMGIPADVLPRIFEPFFTTKQAGNGTGLGLAVVHGIVEQHGGWIRCRSTPGTGTCFDVYLPHTLVASGATPDPPALES
jgi:signal transduction histidine kinase